MKTTCDIDDCKKAVAEYVKILEEGGCKVDISEVDYKEIRKAANDEYRCGADGSVLDIILDWNDSIGTEEFGIKII